MGGERAEAHVAGGEGRGWGTGDDGRGNGWWLACVGRRFDSRRG